MRYQDEENPLSGLHLQCTSAPLDESRRPPEKSTDGHSNFLAYFAHVLTNTKPRIEGKLVGDCNHPT